MFQTDAADIFRCNLDTFEQSILKIDKFLSKIKVRKG